MKEKITYSSDLKCLFDLCNRADLNDSVAQFKLAKFYLHINRENTNKKAFLTISFIFCGIILFDEFYNLIFARVLGLPRATAIYRKLGFPFVVFK